MIKKASKLKEKKYRDEYGLFIVEGEKFVDEITNFEVEAYLLSESFVNKRKYEEKGKIFIVKDDAFKKLSDTVNPQGVLAVCKKKEYTVSNLFEKENPFIVIGERIADPGNLGTIIRTADAAGADGVVLSKNSVDIYNPKVIRSTAGSIFHIPIIVDVELPDFVATLREQNVDVFGAHLSGRFFPYDLNLRKSVALIVGNESEGLSEKIVGVVNKLVKIPMSGKAESLNASVACGILMYEVVRQRTNSLC